MKMSEVEIAEAMRKSLDIIMENLLMLRSLNGKFFLENQDWINEGIVRVDYLRLRGEHKAQLKIVESSSREPGVIHFACAVIRADGSMEEPSGKPWPKRAAEADEVAEATEASAPAER